MPQSSWKRLVKRSFKAWGAPKDDEEWPWRDFLKECTSMDDLMRDVTLSPMFWFFQKRGAFLAQKTMTKWSPDHFDDYILLPAAKGFVTRSKCFFVSHFWHSSDHPDPDGTYLRLHQQELRQQTWSYIWVDWTCAPQQPRSPIEEALFLRTLRSMPGIIRNSGFAWFYPPFEPRLWILFEVAEFILTCTGQSLATDDVKPFAKHIDEMINGGVRQTLEKYNYRCSYERDKEFLISWLEVVCLMRRLDVHIDDIRHVLDHMTWNPSTEVYIFKGISGLLLLKRFQGVLVVRGETYTFTPFQIWEDGKFATSITTTKALQSSISPHETESLPASTSPHETESLPASTSPYETVSLQASTSPHETESLPASTSPYETVSLPASTSPHETEPQQASTSPHETERPVETGFVAFCFVVLESWIRDSLHAIVQALVSLLLLCVSLATMTLSGRTTPPC